MTIALSRLTRIGTLALVMAGLAALPGTAQAQRFGGGGYRGGYGGGYRGGFGGYRGGFGGYRGGFGYGGYRGFGPGYGGYRGFYGPYRGYGYGYGPFIGRGFGYYPGAYYAPPPVVVAPAPIYYAVPPVLVPTRPRPHVIHHAVARCNCIQPTPAAAAPAAPPALPPQIKHDVPSPEAP